MASSDVFTLGLGLTPPWRMVDQRLETDRQPNELHLAVAAASRSLRYVRSGVDVQSTS